MGKLVAGVAVGVLLGMAVMAVGAGAAKEDPTLTLLCERFRASGAQVFMEAMEADKKGNLPAKRVFSADDLATFRALTFMKRTVCPE